jgi:DNA-binding Xre family transcriptional regulator
VDSSYGYVSSWTAYSFHVPAEGAIAPRTIVERGSIAVRESESTEFPLGFAVASNLRRFMKERGTSVQDLARKTGIELTCVESILRGQSAELTLTDLQLLADALEVRVMDLVKSAPKES